MADSHDMQECLFMLSFNLAGSGAMDAWLKKMWKPLYSCVVILMVSLHSILLNGFDSSVRHVNTAVGYALYCYFL